MSFTPPSEALPVSGPLSRPVLLSGAAVVAATVLAASWLLANPIPVNESPDMVGMAMAPDPWSADYLLASFTMWALMMVAMMLPAASPMILLHARIDRGTQSQRMRSSLLFILCYLLIWAAFAAIAAFLQATLIAVGLLSAANLAVGNRGLAAGILAAAALWQLTGAKAACLEQCQSPIRFIMRYWHPGVGGAVQLGIRHGLFCLGCCWSLMLLLFVGGVMNLTWIAGLAAIVFMEKLAPPAWRAERWIAGLLLFGAGLVLLN